MNFYSNIHMKKEKAKEAKISTWKTEKHIHLLKPKFLCPRVGTIIPPQMVIWRAFQRLKKYTGVEDLGNRSLGKNCRWLKSFYFFLQET